MSRGRRERGCCGAGDFFQAISIFNLLHFLRGEAFCQKANFLGSRLLVRLSLGWGGAGDRPHAQGFGGAGIGLTIRYVIERLTPEQTAVISVYREMWRLITGRLNQWMLKQRLKRLKISRSFFSKKNRNLFWGPAPFGGLLNF